MKADDRSDPAENHSTQGLMSAYKLEYASVKPAYLSEKDDQIEDVHAVATLFCAVEIRYQTANHAIAARGSDSLL